MAEALKGGVSTFADVMKQPGYVNNTPDMQATIARDFFNERVATQDGYVNNTPELQQQIKKDFQSQYKVAFPVTPTEGLGNIANDLLGGVSQFVTGLPQMPGQIAQSIGNAWTQEQKAPPLDPFEQLGTMGLGAVEGLRNLANAGLALPTTIQNSYSNNNLAKPAFQIPQLPQPLNQLRQKYPFTSGLGEQALNAIPLSRGAQAANLGNTLKEAAIYGGLGFAGTQGNLKERAGSGLMGAALPALGYEASLPFRAKAGPAVKPMLRGRVVEQGLKVQQPGLLGRLAGKQATVKPERFTEYIAPDVKDARTLTAGIDQLIADLPNRQAISAKKTLEAQLKTLEDAYKNTSVLASEPSQAVSTAAKAKLENIKTVYDKLKADYAKQYPSAKTVKQASVKTISSKAQKEQIIKLGVKYRKQGGEAAVRFNNTLKKYSKNDQQLLNAAIKERFTAERASAQKLNEKAAIRKAVGKEKAALNQAKQKTDLRIDEAKQKASIRVAEAEAKSAIRQAEKSRQQVEQSRAKAEQKGYAPVQSETGIERNINHAYETKTHAIVEYVAQGGATGRGGESLNSNYRFKRDTVISPVFENANGDKIYKVINNEGQERTRHINHEDSGSRTVSVTRTEEPAQFTQRDGKIINNATGEVIEQVKTEGVFSKVLEAELEQSDRIERFLKIYKKRNLKVSEIMNPGKRVSDKKLMETLEKHPEASKDIASENNGERCR